MIRASTATWCTPPPRRCDPAAGTVVVVLTPRADTGVRAGGRWFAGGRRRWRLPAARRRGVGLGRRLTRPLRDARGHRPAHRRGRPLGPRLPSPTATTSSPSSARSINAMAADARSGREAWSGSSCCRCPTTCARRSRRSAGSPKRSPSGAAPDDADGGRGDHQPRRAASSASCATCSIWPSSTLASFSLALRPTDVAEVVSRHRRGLPPRGRRRRRRSRGPRATAARSRRTADPDRLAQVVANLVENALKFAATEITGRRPPPTARLVLWRSATTGRASRPRTCRTCSSALHVRRDSRRARVGVGTRPRHRARARRRDGRHRAGGAGRGTGRTPGGGAEAVGGARH